MEDILYRYGAACDQPEDIHARKCEDLSRKVAIETGQANAIGPGMITFKHPSGIGQIDARCWYDLPVENVTYQAECRAVERGS